VRRVDAVGHTAFRSQALFERVLGCDGIIGKKEKEKNRLDVFIFVHGIRTSGERFPTSDHFFI